MNNLLLRGLTANLKVAMERIAEKRHLSLNQAAIQLIAFAIEQEGMEREQRKKREQAFRKIKELRGSIFKKHGYKQNSLKLLHEARAEREGRLHGLSGHH